MAEPDPEYLSIEVIVTSLATGRKVSHRYPKVRNAITHVEPRYAETSTGSEWWFTTDVVDFGVTISFDAERGEEGYTYLTDRREAGDGET